MGHIVKLGTPDALRNYSLKPSGDGLSWTRGPANPFGVKINASGLYDKVDTWNEWVQEDWQTGVGRVDPQGGGFLYAEAETRVPNQIILPPLARLLDGRVLDNTTADCRYMPTGAAGIITVGSGGYSKAAMSFTTPGTVNGSTMGYFFYACIPDGVSVTLTTYTNSGGSPSTPINSTTVTGTIPDKNFHWYGNNITHGSLTTSTQYWIVIEPTSSSDTIEVAYGSSGYDTVAKYYSGATWATLANTYLFFMVDVHQLYNSASDDRKLFRFNGTFYTTMDESLYKLSVANNNFTSVGTITGSGDITSVAVFGPTVFFGRSSGNYTTMNTSESFSAAATTRTLFLEYNGYLYGTYQNDLYYTVDGSTWSSAFQVGGDDVEIRGIAGMANDLYMATDKALYRFAPGEVVEEITRFGEEDTTNGVGMLEYQGRLYIPAGQRLLRFDPSGQLIDIWVSRENDLPSARIGKIVSMARLNNWLAVLVIPASGSIMATIWLWQEEGWHFLAETRQTNVSIDPPRFTLFYDRATTRLYYTVGRATHYVAIEDYTLNPYNSTTYLYQPYGWLEQDKFYGGQYLLNKAFDGVTIVADNLSATTFVQVYWQDEGSTGWELLGTATQDGQELRWPFSTRPLGKWIKLGLLLQTNSGTETPRVRAVIVKNLPMTQDRRRDTVNITLKDYIEMPDGVPDTYTLIEQLTHIEQMIENVGPFVYQDPIGRQYEVMIVDHNMGMPRFDHYGGQNRVKELDVTLVLEQLPAETYSAQPIGLLLALTRSFA